MLKKKLETLVLEIETLFIMVSSPVIAQIVSYYEKIRINVTIMKIGSTLSSLFKIQI